jgi:dihydrofolate synthase/folylpolyglutamate synthase
MGAMTPGEAAAYLTSKSWSATRLGLERMGELLARMGGPHERLRFAHVAGTNGKGSICAMLSSILARAGHRTGLYTSPAIAPDALGALRESIRIDGEPVSGEDLAEAAALAREGADGMGDHPTGFELATAAALAIFERKGCGIAVLEAGLGGRLDATNAIPAPDVAVIAAIGLDHTAELGGSLGRIAAEKAGIAKPGGTTAVMYSPQPEEAARAVEAACREAGARLIAADVSALRVESSSLDGHVVSFMGWDRLRLPLLGAHQPCNAATALTAVLALREKGWRIPDAAVRAGLAETRWPARFELVSRRPAFVLDGGHNPQGAEALAASLALHFPGRKAVFLFGAMADKDCGAMADAILPLASRVIAVAPGNPRALAAEALAGLVRAKGFARAEAAPSVAEGVRRALAAAGDGGLACAFGSLFMAGEIRAFFGLR